MGQSLQLFKPQEPARTLNGMDAAKDAGQQVGRSGITFQLHELAVEPIEILIALDQKFLNQIVQVKLPRSPSTPRTRALHAPNISSERRGKALDVSCRFQPTVGTEVCTAS